MNKRAGERCSRSYLCQGDCWEAKHARSVCNTHHKHNELLDIEFLPLISLCWARDKTQEERCKCAFSKHSRTFRISDFFKPVQGLQLLHRSLWYICAFQSGQFLNWRMQQWAAGSAQVGSWMEGHLDFPTYGSANVCSREQALSAQNTRLIVSVPWGTHFPRPC